VEEEISFGSRVDYNSDHEEGEPGEVIQQEWPTLDQYIDIVNDTLNAANSTAELNKAWDELALDVKLEKYPDQNDANMIKRVGQRMFDKRERELGGK
jgi:hypothetical protein